MTRERRSIASMFKTIKNIETCINTLMLGNNTLGSLNRLFDKKGRKNKVNIPQ
jgi:hypothetical protein